MSRRKALFTGGVVAVLLLSGCMSPEPGAPSESSGGGSTAAPLPNLSPDPTVSPSSTVPTSPTPTDSSVPPSQPIIHILWYETTSDPIPSSSSPGPHCPKVEAWVREDHVQIDQEIFHAHRDEPALLLSVATLEPDFDWTSAYRASVSAFPQDHASGHPDDPVALLIDRNETTGRLWVDGEEVTLPHRWTKDSPDGRSHFEGNLTLGPERSEVLRPSPGCT